MWVVARFPRFAAWVTAVLVIGSLIAGALLGLRALPLSPASGRDHTHGLIVVIRGEREFAVEVAGRRGMEWFEVAPGAHISMAHLWRHLRERAPTDITYDVASTGALMAMSAD